MTMPAVKFDEVSPIGTPQDGLSRGYDCTRPLLFMHIPKTSGIALAQGLTEALEASDPVAGFDRSLFGHFEAYDDLAPALRRTVFLSPPGLPNDTDFVCAHVAFSTLEARFPDPQCVTFLREPTSRLLSHWMYWRSQSDDLLQPWGKWGDRVRLARGSLSDFLSATEIACQTDNISTRMLLWPHPLIPCDGFIDPRHDHRLLAEAEEKLRRFAYVDVIENPNFAADLSTWIGRRFSYPIANETAPIPDYLRIGLHQALTPLASDLVEKRSRLDAELWKMVIRDQRKNIDLEALRLKTVMRSAARHAWLMTAPRSPPKSPLRRLIRAGGQRLNRLIRSGSQRRPERSTPVAHRF